MDSCLLLTKIIQHTKEDFAFTPHPAAFKDIIPNSAFLMVLKFTILNPSKLSYAMGEV